MDAGSLGRAGSNLFKRALQLAAGEKKQVGEKEELAFWATKRGKIVPSWRRRFFVCETSAQPDKSSLVLSYWSDEKAAKTRNDASAALKGRITVESVVHEHGLGVKIHDKSGRTYLLQMENVQDMQSLLQIEDTRVACQGTSGTRVASQRTPSSGFSDMIEVAAIEKARLQAESGTIDAVQVYSTPHPQPTRVQTVNQLPGKPLLMAFLGQEELDLIVSNKILYWWPLDNGHANLIKADTGDQSARTLACNHPDGIVFRTVTTADFHEAWVDDPTVKDPLAAVAALVHIEKHQLHTVCGEFIHPYPKATKRLPTEQRGLSKQFFIDFKTRFKLPADMRVLVVLHMMRFLTAGTNRSFAELMQGQNDSNGNPYLAPVNLFVSHFTGYVFCEDIDAIDVFEEQEGTRFSSFVDVFAINQNNVGAAEEIASLNHVIACAKTTLLVFSPWHNPSVIVRVWCL
jgi:hypothetical protein